ncbi:MAG: DUF115 domain-containing protein [Tepidisphaera sp.]|nr:DUF115 domain-containing protein [Tepidisphaera sp.]
MSLTQHTLLEKNLAIIARRSPLAAERIRATLPSPAIRLESAPDGGLTGVVLDGPTSRQLASRRGPIAEGRALAATVDIIASAATVVTGFGVGHHVAALAMRLKQDGAIFVFEPDVALLRAVFEQSDCTPWLGASNIVIITDADDTGAMAAGTQGLEALLASGTKILQHPPSKARLADQADRFIANFTGVMKAVRTMVVTTLVQMDVTVRNLTQNIRWYATAPGIRDLRDAAKGRPAIIVAAGPSLRRNIDLLSQPGIRDRVVIIAVQTVLRPLLAKGIRPHFVTALDYHEISRRFYEGLSAADVEGVTLVAEPKCNPAILAAWPGALRCVADDTLDRILGESLYRPLGKLTPGATVAHLAYYLARHLGCDPAIFIGQDLGFTDGQYYAPGAAIHQVWSNELNDFNTLEMLEWQRIMRLGSQLRPATDTLGRRIYTDEQMSTYLVQFERDFLRDTHDGLLIIDATEGGVAKRHTLPMTLAHALDAYATQPLPPLPLTPADADARRRLAQCEHRLRELRRSTGSVAALSRDAGAALREMLARHDDQSHVNTLITRTRDMGERAVAEPAFWLVNHVNQTGQLNRFKADRAIEADAALSPMQRQRREIERDAKNVKWMEDASHLVEELIDDALATLRSGQPKTRDDPPPPSDANQTRPRVLLCVRARFTKGGLHTPRDLFAPLADGRTVGAEALARAARVKGVASILILTDDAPKARQLISQSGLTCDCDIEVVRFDDRRARAIAAARAFARHCWRGAIGGQSVFDEICEPALLAPLLDKYRADAAACVGADWCLFDPALMSDTIERYAEHPQGRPVAFSQAPPGLCGCVVSLSALRDMAHAGGPTATLGAVLGYVPVAPQADPIAKPMCVSVPPSVRDTLARFIADTPAGLSLARRALAAGATTAAITAPLANPEPPTHLVLRLAQNERRALLQEALRDLARVTPALAVTLASPHAGPDPLLVAGVGETAAMARAFGAFVHLRTSLPSAPHVDTHTATALTHADVVSIDIPGDTQATYALLGGVGQLDDLRSRVAELIRRAYRDEASLHAASSAQAAAEKPPALLPRPWIVPRIERRDETYADIENFYHRWLLASGCCVIDPPRHASPDQRIQRLPLPANAAALAASTTLDIDEHANVSDGAGRPLGSLLDRGILEFAGLAAGALA